jgi:hypothetical protein
LRHVVVVLTDAERVEYTLMTRDTEPSAANTGVGTTVTLDGMMPVAAKIDAAAAAATCSCIAAITDASFPTPGGKAKDSVCVTLAVTVSVKVITASPPGAIETVDDQDVTGEAAKVAPVLAVRLGERTSSWELEMDALGVTARDAIAPLAANDSVGF